MDFIGYRNVSYSIRPDTKQGYITLYTWDLDGNPIVKEFDHNVSVYYNTIHKTRYKSIFDKHVEKKLFKNLWERNKFIDTFAGKEQELVAVTRPEMGFLASIFSDQYHDIEFQKYPLRTHFIDIELATDGGEFPETDECRCPINLITVYDTKLQQYMVFAHGNIDREHETHDTRVFQFNSEVDLLRGYFDWYCNNYPDIISGWNSIAFDIPYILNRTKKILGNKVACLLSPEQDIHFYKKFTKQGQSYDTVNIKGVTHLDYMVLYRDKFLHRCPTGFSLESVCQHELNEGKRDTLADISFEEQWQKHFDDYLLYNLQDVRLLVKLDHKLRLIDLTRKICTTGLSPYETIYGTVQYLIAGLSLFAKKHNKIFPTYTNPNNYNKDYEGAFVLDSKKGVFTGGVTTIDLNSLYPNTMIALNLSPETRIGKIVKHNKEKQVIELSRADDTTFEIPIADFKTKVFNNAIISSNNVLYLKPSIKQGIIPLYLKHYYNERIKVKKEGGKLKRQLKKCKDEAQIAELEEKIKLNNTIDTSLKIQLNSVYGIFGTKFSPIYDVDSAAAITITGQMVIKTAMDFLNKTFKDKYGLENAVCYGDTDSVTGDTKIKTLHDVYTIEELYNMYKLRGILLPIDTRTQKEEINIFGDTLYVRVGYEGNNYYPVNRIIRHKTTKQLYEIVSETGTSVTVTEDHSCIVRRSGNIITVKPTDIIPETDMLIEATR